VSEQLFVHSARPQWGRAIVASQGAGRRVYQFEDGKTRVIARDYWDLMVPVAGTEEDVSRSLRRLRLLVKGADSSLRSSPPSTAKSDVDEQIQLIATKLGTFENDAYQARFRQDANRKLKANIDPSIALAQEKLVEGEYDFAESDDRKDAKAWFDAVLEVLNTTDLMTASERKELAAVKGKAVDSLAQASWTMIRGEVTFAEAFQLWLEALAEAKVRATWGTATALPALVWPKKHVCIRATVFKSQASGLMPGLVMDSEAELAVYESLQRMATDLYRKLEESKLKPQDLFDVRNFIWLTLRKDAETRIEKL
jgi:hypothetical protein